MGWAFPVEVDPRTGRIKTLELEEDIRQSIRFLLKTVRGERRMKPLYGSSLHQFIFEPVSYELVREIREETIRTIRFWEKRVEDVDAEVFQAADEETRLLIRISYRIREMGRQEETEFSFRLNM